ncbi:hypothetical protein C0Q70_15762 [Pomacea canaliculata]|uniref:Glutathione transferase n=1 Tax=Pomacea canaliculata TaxID=400727 RepID=A0A2T7NVT1_POMCA|nr:probable glutathione S-transferase 6 [Pomacea canaliculata]XP_025108066.1 probable glutathione S-transferase 6 [Pomacea canaliculata]PVD25264.1 hypothetical protein C0Q70_15762 [Pomacea canaliculata]
MADLKFVYFNLQARGEPVRLILAAAGQKYKDVRLSFLDWPKEMSKAPYGQLPYAVYNGKPYGQTVALANFFARKFGLYGKTDVQNLRVDEAVALSGDFINIIYNAKSAKDDLKKEELNTKLFEVDAPKFLGYFQTMLKENGDTGYLVGDSLTQADLFLYNVLDALIFEKSDAASIFPPEIAKLREQVENLPGLKEYIASRPKVKF